MLLPKCELCGSKKSKFIKEQAARLISNLGIKAPLSKIPIVSPGINRLISHTMNEIVHKFLLAGDKFLAEMYLRQSGFTYSACGSFIKKQRKNTKN